MLSLHLHRRICHPTLKSAIYLHNNLIDRARITFSSAQWVRSMSGKTSTESWSSLSSCMINRSDCGLLEITGADSLKFLQGLMSNDIESIRDAGVGYTVWHSHRGRYLFDTLITSVENSSSPTFLLHCEGGSLPFIGNHLMRFKLRSKVSISDVSDKFKVWSYLDGGGTLALNKVSEFYKDKGMVFVDPRTSVLGLRILLPPKMVPTEFPIANVSVYDTLCVLHGIPRGGLDMPFDKALPLEYNLDWLGGFNFHKGCYLGQELTARIHFQGLIRKRLVPVILETAQSSTPKSPTFPSLSSLSSDDSSSLLFPSFIDPSFDLITSDMSNLMNGAVPYNKPQAPLPVHRDGKKVGRFFFQSL